MLREHEWKVKYTSEDGYLLDLFYIPALKSAVRYDRITGYFNAKALTLASRGIEGLIHNKGRMRLIVGCTLDPPEIKAITQGETLRSQVEKHLSDKPLMPSDVHADKALELLSWMIVHNHLEVKVAVPCDADGKPIPDNAIFHEKSGIIKDREHDRIAWTGSLNETPAGWKNNWETIHVFTSWANWRDTERVGEEDENFTKLWSPDHKHKRVSVINVPTAIEQDLMRFLPDNDGTPRRLQSDDEDEIEKPPNKPKAPTPPSIDLRSRVWNFIAKAPRLADGGSQVGEATSAVVPWPHQVRTFDRLYRQCPPKLLIADEVGLGKTIQAGMLLRQAWLAGYAKRILILAPKAVLGQWQIELREKFNLNWPIYDGQNLVWYQSPGLANHERPVDPNCWHEEPMVIASSHLMRRSDRAEVLLGEEVEPWDIVVLDEAHHARRSSEGASRRGKPNMLLTLMKGLKERTQGLLLLTATPMQINPVEVWDLLDLLGLPPEWAEEEFLQFFQHIEQPNPSNETMDHLAQMFLAVEKNYGKMAKLTAQGITGLSPMRTNKILKALRHPVSIRRRRLSNEERQAAIKLMRAYTPIRHLISRHTRELLRRYTEAVNPSTQIAERQVDDEFIQMTDPERDVYNMLEKYIAITYNQATARERSAVGFVMTVYRRRFASSLLALRITLENRLEDVGFSTDDLEEDIPDDETSDEVMDADKTVQMAQQALAFEEQSEIKHLIERIQALPPDSKLNQLTETIAELRVQGYEQIMVFTQYVNTMDFLRNELTKEDSLRLMCYSGNGGEIPSTNSPGGWKTINRHEARQHFQEGKADVLLCTDAAAEGLNFQFCGALVNYDMPWNPMRVEQRIGRIDRLGQKYSTIRIVNLHYEDTVETNIYIALRERIGLFEKVVGGLQPILAQLPNKIHEAVLTDEHSEQEKITENIKREIAESEEQHGFDIDKVLDDDITMPKPEPSPLTMEDLDRVITNEDLMPSDTIIKRLSQREYSLLAPGMTEPVRVTTKRCFFENHVESVELWSPGSPLFNPPEPLAAPDGGESARSLKEILDDG